MLEHYFLSATRLRQMRRGPLAGHLDGLAADLRRRGYAAESARAILSLAAKFSFFARVAGVAAADKIDTALVNRFLGEELTSEGRFRGAANAMCHVIDHLHREGVIKAPALEPEHCEPAVALLDRYDGHLARVRGLTATTREAYRCSAKRLLGWWCDRAGEAPLSMMSGPDLLTFITEHIGRHCSNSWRRRLCSELRAFLRFLRWESLIPVDLVRVVPRMRRWRLDTIPRHLPWNQVRALIDSVDASHPEGLRDKAILLLIAGLGLRNGEVRTLEFRQIAWRVAELRLPRTKNRRERILPLSREIGEAIADYVMHGRPPLAIPQVFVRHRAPHGALASPGAVGGIISRHLKRTGIAAPSRGAHLLRHSLATRMVNAGVPIKQIADTLGHRSIDTTAIYTKVDVATLAAVAMPFPEGGAA